MVGARGTVLSEEDASRSPSNLIAADFSDDSRSTGTLGKAMSVLEIIVQSDHPLRFTDILAVANQPRGTLHRQIANLIEEGLVSVNPDQSYGAGLRLLKLAARSWAGNTLRSVAEPHIRQLNERTGETVHLGVLDGTEVVYVDKLESKRNVRMHSQVGNASPLYCTGVGKAMLALLPKDECARLVGSIEFVRHTEHTLFTPELLLNDIAAIRESGISYDREEHEPGIKCVAAGILHSKSATIAGISVTAPAFRIEEGTLANWETWVLETALAIESDLEDQLGPRSGE